MELTNTYSKYFKYFLLAVILYMPIFGHLDTVPIRIWDEARVVMNAYEMYYNGKYIVTYFDGHPDMWNTKPPLLIWCQVLFMKIMGINELAVRLPSAIAGFLTCLAILIFSERYLKSFWFGFIAIFVLITSLGYVNLHSTRSADYDAMLTLFTTLSGLIFFAFTETKKYKYLYLFFLFTALAVLTKSVTGLLFLPAIFLYALIRKQIIPLLKSKHFYFGLAGFLVLVVGYYVLRELQNPGYFAAVQQNELGGRYLELLEEHNHSFWYYYNNMVDFHLQSWYLLVPLGLIVGAFHKDPKVKRLTLFVSLMIVLFFLVISFSKTKLLWYDVPMYPFISILIAVFIYWVFQFLSNSKWINQVFSINVVPFVFLFVIGFDPYQEVLERTYTPKRHDSWSDFYSVSYYLKNAVKGKHDLNNQYVLYEGYNTHNLFYIKLLNEKGTNISFKDWTDLSPGDIVIAHQPHVREYVEQHYMHEVKRADGNVITYEIYGEKE